MALAGYAVQNRVDRLVGQRVDPPELGVKAGGILRHLGEGIVNLIVENHLLGRRIRHRDAATFPEWHRPVAVESAPRIHAHGERGDRGILTPSAGKEVTYRAFD